MNSDSFYRIIAEQSNNWEDLIGTDGRLVWVNPAVERVTGYTVEECLAMDDYPFPLIIEEDREKAAREIEGGLHENKTGRNSECRIRRKDGAVRWISASWQPVYDEQGRYLGLRSSMTDITEWKMTEEALRQSEEKFRTTVENSLSGIFIVQDDRFVFVNQRLADITRYDSPAQVTGRLFWELVHPDFRDFVRERAARRLKGIHEPDHYEFKGLGKDGTSHWVEIRSTLASFQGRPAIVGNIIDVDTRHRAEEALRGSEQQYRTLFGSIRDAILVADTDRNILDCNQAFTDLFGYTLEEIKGRKTDYVYASQADYDALGERLRDSHRVSSFIFTIRYRKKSGEVFPGETNVFRYKNDTGETIGYIGLIRDISQREMLEEQLRQAQKMEAVGRLAGGIAHDFNNLLTGIMGSAEMALMGGGIGESVDEYLQDIKQSAERAASLTAQLLAYSRRQVLRPVILDLNDLVSRNQKILSRFLGEHITLETRLHPGAGRVKADPGLFDQVILNLAVNARDAMPEGGRLTIETRSETLDKDFYALHPDVKPGEYVVMSVSDTGHGMDESTLQRIFEPFFTTKETGRGTGLGLSSVYGTVRQSSGHVFVESRPGRGTTFTLYLPRTREKEETEPRPGCCRKGSETILLTEDDQAVRTMMRKVLERYGYSVIETRCGRETLETLEGGLHKEPDLLITDVVMPGMSGGELAQQLSRQYPGLKVLFISGYTGDLVHRHRRAQDSQPGESLKGHGFLQKPFSPDALANKVRDILDDILDETNAVVSL